MSQPDFTAVLERELQLLGVAFSRADLLAFVAAIWPLAQDNADVVTWAGAFIDSGHATVTA